MHAHVHIHNPFVWCLFPWTRREVDIDWPVSNITLSPEDEFNKVSNHTLSHTHPNTHTHTHSQCWLSVVQGNTPCSVDQAVKLAAIQYQVYIQHRTAMNSTVAFCKWVWPWSECTPVLPCHSSYVDTHSTHTHTYIPTLPPLHKTDHLTFSLLSTLVSAG